MDAEAWSDRDTTEPEACVERTQQEALKLRMRALLNRARASTGSQPAQQVRRVAERDAVCDRDLPQAPMRQSKQPPALLETPSSGQLRRRSSPPSAFSPPSAADGVDVESTDSEPMALEDDLPSPVSAPVLHTKQALPPLLPLPANARPLTSPARMDQEVVVRAVSSSVERHMAPLPSPATREQTVTNEGSNNSEAVDGTARSLSSSVPLDKEIVMRAVSSSLEQHMAPLSSSAMPVKAITNDRSDSSDATGATKATSSVLADRVPLRAEPRTTTTAGDNATIERPATKTKPVEPTAQSKPRRPSMSKPTIVSLKTVTERSRSPSSSPATSTDKANLITVPTNSSPAEARSIKKSVARSTNSTMLMLQMLVPSNAVGFLLGKRGENIQRLNRETHCTLSVRDSRFADDRVLRVYGLMDDICAAQRLVLDGIRQHRVDKQDPNYMNLANQGLVPLPDSSLSETTTTALSAFMRRRGSDDDEDDEDVQVVRWLVRHDQVGKIMGHGGATLTAIANQTGTKLSVSSIRDMPPGSNERVVTITGSTDAVEHARQMIEDIAGGRAKDPGFNGKRGQYFAIPLQSSGPLIGPNGATIKNIAERTGARLQIAAIQDLPLGSINRTLHIQGSAKQIKHAFSLVCNKIRELQNSKRKNSTTTNADEVSFRLILPIRVCSRLLNQRGARIRGIIETSGAHARFLDPQDDDTRICVVSGDLENVLHAQRLILGVLASESGGAGRRGSGSSGGSAVPRKRKQRDEEEDEDVETITERSTARPRNPNGRKVTLVNADGGRRQQQKKPRLL